MPLEIDIQEALGRDDLVFIDVRSPGEYNESSIPGSINIPLFDDSEHHQLGIIYHQCGETEARRKALDFAAPKLPAIARQIDAACGEKIPLLYCRRGGMRSLSLYQVLSMTGGKVLRLKKGYRAYRKLVSIRLSAYRLESKLVVLHGLTGVGKTAVLLELGKRGYPVINLEGLARHRGSVFGAVGLDPQRSQKDFEALLLQEFDRLNGAPLIFIEGEGRRIGNIYLPAFLAEAMGKGFKVLLKTSLATRVDRILATYGPQTLAEQGRMDLEKSIISLQKRLGRQNVKQLLDLLAEEDYRALAEFLCREYYDHLYDDSRPETARFDCEVDAGDLGEAIDSLIKLATTNT